jgi:5-deoxy-glucuronate isomerase
MTYRFHTTIAAEKGHNTLELNPCSVLDFSLVRLGAGERHTGSSGDREILAVVLGGRATFEVDGHRFDEVGERSDVFSGKPHSVYIPTGADFTIEGLTAVEIALPSAPSDLAVEPYLIAPDEVVRGRWGAANFGRDYHQILTEISQPELPAARLIVGETYTPSGNWSTYPPHRHKVDNLPEEAQHEEIYYYRVSTPEGFGISRMYTDEGYEENYTIRDHAVQLLPEGYHTVVCAPGCTTYFLWFLGGTGRTQGAKEDEGLAWVGETVPTLRSVGQ